MNKTKSAIKAKEALTKLVKHLKKLDCIDLDKPIVLSELMENIDINMKADTNKEDAIIELFFDKNYRLINVEREASQTIIEFRFLSDNLYEPEAEGIEDESDEWYELMETFDEVLSDYSKQISSLLIESGIKDTTVRCSQWSDDNNIVIVYISFSNE
jgi:hypothetical protein